MKYYLFFLITIFCFRLVAQEVISIVASDSIPPYVMGDEPMSKELPGLQVEIVDAAFSQVGLQTNWKTMPNKRVILQYQKGAVDVALNLPDSSAIETFSSDDLVFYRNCVIGSNRYKETWKSKASQLKILGFQNARYVFHKSFTKGTLAANKNYNEVPSQKTIAYHAVNARADLVLSDALVFAYYAYTYFGPQYLKTDLVCLHEQKIARHLGFRSKQLRDRFNAGFMKIKENGIYDALLKKYNERFKMLTRLESTYQSKFHPLAIISP